MTSDHRTATAGDVEVLVNTLYRQVDEILVQGGIDSIEPGVIARLNTLGVKLYAAARAADMELLPVLPGEAVTATDAAIFCSDLLAVVNLDLFELSLWRGMGHA